MADHGDDGGDEDQGHVEEEAAAQADLDDQDLPPAEKAARRQRVREEADEDLGTERPPGPARA